MTAVAPAGSLPRPVTRRYELDAMRGILLLMMALTHLPTALSPYANQPLGFVSAAEGFVFLSALLVGSIYSPQLIACGIEHVRSRLWKRARRLYGFHAGLLLFAFTVVAGIGYLAHSSSLHNFLSFYFHAPGRAVLAASVLLYQPPLMDILPMYIAFLLLTPLVLQWAARRGWWLPLSLSLLLWATAQWHAGERLYGALAALGYPLPKNAWSSFDWLAWQLIWVAGLWLGSGQRTFARPSAVNDPPVWWLRPATQVLAAALPLTVLLFCERHQLSSLFGGLDMNGPLVNKWHLGPLRLVNFALLAFVIQWLLLPVLKWVRIGVLELLGRSSLEVFTAHIPACMLAAGLVDVSAPRLSAVQQLMMLVLMLGVMLLVAWRADTPRRAPRGQPRLAAVGARAVTGS